MNKLSLIPGVRLTYEFVKEQIERELGYRLLSKEYKNNKTKLKIICPNGHQYETNYNRFQQGQRCQFCSLKRKSQVNLGLRLKYEFVKEQIEREPGYKLLSTEYVNNLTKLKVECSEGHQYEVQYGNFQQGQRCAVCGHIRLKYEFVKEQFEKEGYKLLSTEYISSHYKLSVECPEGHQYKIRPDGFFNYGVRCGVCYGKQRLKYEFVKEQFEKEGYKLLSKKYVNSRGKLNVECPEGHKYKATYDIFQQGKRCPVCWNLASYSRLEKDCCDVVKQLTNENIIENDRTQIINPKTNQFLELDIWIPLLKKAIEFNGEYWHDNDYSRYKDNQKVEQCKEKNIDLIVIEERAWSNNREKEIDNLKEFLNEKS